MRYHFEESKYIFHLTIPIIILILFIFSCWLLFEEIFFYFSLVPFFSMPIVNTLCITLPSLFISYVSGIAFLLNKSLAVLFLGNAFLVSGTGSLLAGCMLFLTGSPNILVTIHNLSVLLSSVFLLAGSWLHFSSEPSFCTRPRFVLAGMYVSTIILILGLAAAAVIHSTPVFFVQNQGPTLLRQLILITSIIFYIQSAFLLFFKYLKTHSNFLLWYISALVIIAVGLIIILLQQSIGSLINVAGRLLQYLGHVYAMIAVWAALRETKQRHTAEQVLSNFFFDTEVNYQDLVETAPFAITSTDTDGQILIWNSYAETLFEIEKSMALGENLSVLLPLKNKKIIKETVLSYCFTSAFIGEVQAVSRKIPVEVYVASCNTYYGSANTYIFIDLTEKKRCETESSRLSSLDLVGQMAAAIAHEVRNPMATVHSFLQHYSKHIPAAQKKIYALMIDQLDQANSNISEYLALAMNNSSQLAYENLALIVDDLRQSIEAYALKARKHIIIEVDNAKENILMLDAREIKQLISNLVRNALEAISPNGVVKVRVYSEGSDVILSVEDNGCGIKQEILDKLGTPFLTTKSSGKGLGLSVCYRIAARHQAEITVHSSTEGTIFMVRFPREKLA